MRRQICWPKAYTRSTCHPLLTTTAVGFHGVVLLLELEPARVGSQDRREEQSGRGVESSGSWDSLLRCLQQPNTVFDCQPRLDAGALPGDDTGNAHAIHDPSDNAWHPRDDDELANGKLAADVTRRFRAIRMRRAGREGEQKENLRPAAGKDLCIDLVRVGNCCCCPSSCSVRELAKPDLEGLRVRGRVIISSTCDWPRVRLGFP